MKTEHILGRLQRLNNFLLANKQNEVQVLEHLLELQEEYADLENKEEDSNE